MVEEMVLDFVCSVIPPFSHTDLGGQIKKNYTTHTTSPLSFDYIFTFPEKQLF